MIPVSSASHFTLRDSLRLQTLILFAVFVVSLLLGQPVRAEKLRVVYPIPSSKQQDRVGHAYALMVLALKKPGVDYELVQSPVGMVQARALIEVELGRGVDIAWAMTNLSREQRLRPIRIPVDKGVLGWRLLLIQERNAAQFAKIRSWDQLKPLVAVQGHDWPDTDILRSNGVKVQVDADFSNLFKLLERGRVDFFPRSFQEIWPEAARHADGGLVVEQTLVLRYPTALYFFVNKNNTALAKALETGLERAIADGSYEKLFQQFYGDAIKRSKLTTRKAIKLQNPYQPPGMPLQRKELWFQGAVTP